MNAPRQVVVDDQVLEFWSKSAKSGFELGLLVGQVSSSNCGDFVLAVVPIPSENENGDTLTGLSEVSVDWVQEVAQQVDRILPGGISVLGLYVVASREHAKEVVPYLRATAEAVALPSNIHMGDNVHHLALVKSNGDVAFQSFYDVVDVHKVQMLPAKRITPTTDMKFKQYRTLIDLDEPTPFVNVAPTAAMTAAEVAEKRMKEVEQHLKPLFRRVEDAVAVLKLTGDTKAQHMNLLTLTAPESHKIVEDPLGGVHGAVSCVAFVSQNEPEAKDVAAAYLKRDFAKSLLVRVALARERWAEDDEVEPNAVFKEGGVIRLAQRGLVPWRSATGPSPHFSAAIHVFPDEDATEAVKNALEILGGATNSDAAVWSAMEIGGQLGSPMDLTFGMTESEHFKYVYYVLPVVIVLLLLVAQSMM
ncbi:odr-4 protein isoform X2 [Phytophthora megakarya]|uniref:Odr-4 protein isoform X2 n=1 Tax=Phytophthora megakarya TaxID=4795 RepID=A0A225X5V2_9STRA|nr:odr-4 protein isoform X2 [Phytophthora megakarya]